MHEHEEKFIRAFLREPYRGRCLYKGGIPRTELWHLGHFDARRTFELPNNVHLVDRIVPVLRELTASRDAVLISAHREHDGAIVELDQLEDLDGTIVSLDAGRIAY